MGYDITIYIKDLNTSLFLHAAGVMSLYMNLLSHHTGYTL